jgi:Xaa-Pro aminopeptidase
VEATSPIAMAKAIKNEAEMRGMVEAHLRDGVALATFLCFLEEQVRWPLTHTL